MVSFNPVNNDSVKTPVVENNSGVLFKPTGESIDAAKFNAADVMAVNKGENVNTLDRQNLLLNAFGAFNPNSPLYGGMTKGNFTGEVTKSFASGTLNLAKGMGTMAKFYGDNMIITKEVQESLGLDDKSAGYLNLVGQSYQKFGGVIEKYSQMGLEAELLKQDEKIFSGSFLENPSITRTASIVAGSLPSLVFGAGVMKITQSPTLAYLLMAGSEAGDIYEEAKEEAGQAQANIMYVASVGGIAAIDVAAKPLEHILDVNVSSLSKKITKTLLDGSREGISESLQQVWQNFVRKIGLDNTQSLMDGVIESFIGGAGSGGALSFATNGSWQRYENSVNEAKEAGITSEQIEAFENVLADEIAQKREVVNPIIQENIDKSLQSFDDYVTNNAEVLSSEQTRKELQAVYDDTYETLSNNMELVQAKYLARMAQGWALFGAKETGLSPTEYMKQRFPNVVSAKQTEIVEKKNLRRDIEKIKDPRLINKELASAEVGMTEASHIKELAAELELAGVDVRKDDFDTIYRKYKEYQESYRVIESRFTYENELTGEITSDEEMGDFVLFQESSSNIVIEGNEFGNITNITELRKTAKEFYRNNLQGQKVVNPNIGDILFTLKGVKKAINTSADIRKVKLFPKLREIIETAGFVRSEDVSALRNDGIVKFHYLSNMVLLEGNNFNVFVSVGEDVNGNLFYNINEDIKNPQGNLPVQRQAQEGIEDELTSYEQSITDNEEDVNIELRPVSEAAGRMIEGIRERRSAAPKGSITFAEDAKAVINLFESADTSTFVHEMGHFFLNELNEFAKLSGESKGRLNTVNQWLGADNTGIYTREQQEQFARGFEQFVREGKSPSERLKQVFIRFAEWLRNIYKTAEDLGVELSDDVRKVYGDLFGGEALDFLFDTKNPLNERNFDQAWENAIQQFSAEEAKTKEEFYNKNFVEANNKRSLMNRLTEKTKDQIEAVREWVADAIVPLESEIAKIAPEIAMKNRRLEIAKMNRLNEYNRQIKGFVEGMEKLNTKDFYDLDLALKNRDDETALAIINRNNLSEEYGKVQDMLENFYQELVNVGAEVGYLERYFPRRIKDTDGFLDFINIKVSESNRKLLERAIIEREQRGESVSEEEKKKLLEGGLHSKIRDIIAEREKKGAVLSSEDKARIVNSLIRGYGGSITLTNIGNVKSREIDFVDGEMNKYYKLSTDALVEYVSGVATLLEDKKYFGKENKEISALRTRLMGRRRRIKEYEEMDAGMVKGREIRRLIYEVSGQDAKIRTALKEEDRADAEDRKKYLESQIEFFKKLKSDKVKEIVLERMQKEYDEIQKEVEAWDSETIEQSVGKMVLDMVEEGKIDAKKEKRLRELLTARFNQKGMSNTFLKTLRDGGYLATLGNVESAITQLGDLALSAYEGGFLVSTQEFGRALIGKSQITKEMVGLEKAIIQEMNEGATALSKTLDKVLGFTGFEKIDKLGKETLMNSAIEKMRKQAREKTENMELKEYLEAAYGENAGKVKENLAAGELTPEIVEMAMFKLMDYQPIAIDQLPRYYAEGGNLRLFYSLKSYTVRMIDVFRRIAVDKMRKDPVGGIKDLIRLSAYMMIYNVGADLLKDLLFGRKIDIPDTVADNWFMGGVFNKYTVSKFKRGGAGAVVKDLLFPPIVGDIVTKEIFSDKDIKDFRAWANLPVVGRFYYWYVGGGVKKKEQEEKKERNERKNKLAAERRKRRREIAKERGN